MSRRERRLQARKLLREETPTEKPRELGKAGRFFDKHYHKLQIIPIVILLLAIAFNVYFFVHTGDFVKKGVSLAGGTTVTAATADQIDVRALTASLQKEFPQADIEIRSLQTGETRTGFTVDAAHLDVGNATGGADRLVANLKAAYPDATFSVQTTGSSLGQSFFVQTGWAILVAFIMMGLVVFISFRTFYPSMAVVLAGFSTVISTLAVFNFLGLALSTAGVAAFLMLIGYSIDTDILLSTRVLKRQGHFVHNVWSAARTGLTMQVTTACTVLIVLIFSNNPVFTQIMTIILIGMFFDVLYTWLQNASILQWYVQKKERKSHGHGHKPHAEASA